MDEENTNIMKELMEIIFKEHSEERLKSAGCDVPQRDDYNPFQ